MESEQNAATVNLSHLANSNLHIRTRASIVKIYGPSSISWRTSSRRYQSRWFYSRSIQKETLVVRTQTTARKALPKQGTRRCRQ